ncbi:unnamed protein product [Durusdinium trenchii]|uniref:EF-hand domain-containing protein n=1 Tax=Durusdinium trenchii TaxID=1381693 RepID=A0ABP0P7D0_9DINO
MGGKRCNCCSFHSTPLLAPLLSLVVRPTPQYLIRRATSKLHRELVEDTRASDDAGLLGNQGPEGFRLLLSRKFGSVAAAWRVSLDPDGNGRISFGEFNHRCRQMGFTGNLRKLWGELDTDKCGFISLKEIDPKDRWQVAVETRVNQSRLERPGDRTERRGTAYLVELRFYKVFEELELCSADSAENPDLTLPQQQHKRKPPSVGRELKLEDFDPQTGEAVYRADPCAEAISYGGGRKATAAPKPKAPLSPLIMSRCNTSHNLKQTRSRLKTAPSSPMSSSLSAGLLSPANHRSKADTFGGIASPSAAFQSIKTLPPDETLSPPRSPSRSPSRPGSKAHTLKLSSLDLDEDVSPMSRPCHWAADGSKARSLRVDGGEERWDVATPTRNSDYIRSCSKVQVMDRSIREEEKINADVGMMNKDELLLQLGLKYGSLRKAWNEVFDPFDSGKIGFQEFCDRMRNIGFLGDMKECWIALGAERDGVLRLRHLDRKSDELMEGFHNTLCDKYGNMLNAWQTAFDPNGRSLIDEAAFVKQCTEEGVEGDLVQLFHDLLDDPLKQKQYKKMSLREFDLAAYQAYARMDTDMIVEAQKYEKTNPLEMSFEERQDNMFSVKWTRAQSKISRTEMAERTKQENEADVGCETLKTLKAMLTKKYKNLAIAWKVALDPLGQGHLSKEDWYNAVRNRVGFHGDLRQLWNEAAKPGAGEDRLNHHLREILVVSYRMLMDAGLRAQIQAAKRELEEKTTLTQQLDSELQKANERQSLRRDLDRIKKRIALREDINLDKKVERDMIDRDMCGDHLPQGGYNVHVPGQNKYSQSDDASSTFAKNEGQVMNCSEIVAKGEYVWRIEGLSWLENTLKQNGLCYASSEPFTVGGETFAFVYNPSGGKVSLTAEEQHGSLAIIHEDDDGITFRYRIFIKKKGGDFVQWGETGDECHPTTDTCGWAFGPDVYQQDGWSRYPNRKPGIFGLTHKQLLNSDWVEDDALTVKFELEVRPDDWYGRAPLKPHVDVPPSTISSDMRTLLDEAR